MSPDAVSVATLPVAVIVYGPAVPTGGVNPPESSPAFTEHVRRVEPTGTGPPYVQNVDPGSKPQPWMYRVCVSITAKGVGLGVNGPVLLSENAMLGSTLNVAVVVSLAVVVSVTVYVYVTPPTN
jgi:hypothetical protein